MNKVIPLMNTHVIFWITKRCGAMNKFLLRSETLRGANPN